MSQLERKRVVIVDDDRIIRDLLALRCTEMGLEVEAAGDGSGAVDKVRQDRPDLLIVDLNLPDMDGFGVIELLATPDLPPLPVILLTGSSDDGLKQRCQDVNVFHVHKGPDGWDTLQALIRQILDLPSAPDA